MSELDLKWREHFRALKKPDCLCGANDWKLDHFSVSTGSAGHDEWARLRCCGCKRSGFYALMGFPNRFFFIFIEPIANKDEVGRLCGQIFNDFVLPPWRKWWVKDFHRAQRIGELNKIIWHRAMTKAGLAEGTDPLRQSSEKVEIFVNQLRVQDKNQDERDRLVALSNKHFRLDRVPDEKLVCSFQQIEIDEPWVALNP